MSSYQESTEAGRDPGASPQQTLRELLEVAKSVRDLQDQIDRLAAKVAGDVELSAEALPDIAAAFKEAARMELESSSGKNQAQERYAFAQAMQGLPAAWPERGEREAADAEEQ